MMTSNSDYIDRIGLMLLNLPIEGEFDMAKVAPENKDKFIDAVKSYIDRGLGKHDGFYIQPNNTWTKLKKFAR